MKDQLVAYFNKNGLILTCLLVAGLFSFLGIQPAAAQRKSTEELAQIRQTLVAPSQKGIDVDTLTEAELQTADLKQDTKGYTLKNANGVTIRTLLDTDGDGQLDQWGFYKDGIEVFRDFHADVHGGRAGIFHPHNFFHLGAGVNRLILLVYLRNFPSDAVHGDHVDCRAFRAPGRQGSKTGKNQQQRQEHCRSAAHGCSFHFLTSFLLVPSKKYIAAGFNRRNEHARSHG